MRQLSGNELRSVSGGLALNLGKLVVGQQTSATLSSGSGLLGQLLGDLGLRAAVDPLLCLSSLSLSSGGAASAASGTCSCTATPR